MADAQKFTVGWQGDKYLEQGVDGNNYYKRNWQNADGTIKVVTLPRGQTDSWFDQYEATNKPFDNTPLDVGNVSIGNPANLLPLPTDTSNFNIGDDPLAPPKDLATVSINPGAGTNTDTTPDPLAVPGTTTTPPSTGTGLNSAGVKPYEQTPENTRKNPVTGTTTTPATTTTPPPTGGGGGAGTGFTPVGGGSSGGNPGGTPSTPAPGTTGNTTKPATKQEVTDLSGLALDRMPNVTIPSDSINQYGERNQLDLGGLANRDSILNSLLGPTGDTIKQNASDLTSKIDGYLNDPATQDARKNLIDSFFASIPDQLQTASDAADNLLGYLDTPAAQQARSVYSREASGDNVLDPNAVAAARSQRNAELRNAEDAAASARSKAQATGGSISAQAAGQQTDLLNQGMVAGANKEAQVTNQAIQAGLDRQQQAAQGLAQLEATAAANAAKAPDALLAPANNISAFLQGLSQLNAQDTALASTSAQSSLLPSQTNANIIAQLLGNYTTSQPTVIQGATGGDALSTAAMLSSLMGGNFDINGFIQAYNKVKANQPAA